MTGGISNHQSFLSRSLWLRALGALGLPLYRIGLALKGTARPHRVGVPVVSVGNLHIGGTGKTPLVISLARALVADGRRPVVVSRGYRGRLSQRGAVLDENSSAEEAGDEPVEIFRACPGARVIIGANRVEAARQAEKLGDLLILDDGFQHRRLHRDLDIVVIPAASRPESEYLLPLGRLREPLKALERAHAIVLVHEIGEEDLSGAEETWSSLTSARFFHAERKLSGVRPYPGTVSPVALLGQNVVVFSAIANPARVIASAEAAGAKVVDAFTRRDHSVFSVSDIDAVRRLVERHDALALTTAKDAARLGKRALPFPAAILEISLDCPGLAAFVKESIG